MNFKLLGITWSLWPIAIALWTFIGMFLMVLCFAAMMEHEGAAMGVYGILVMLWSYINSQCIDRVLEVMGDG
jgi:hypothetical protein